VKRRIAVLMVVVLVGLLTSGCAKRESKVSEVRKTIRTTHDEATSFVYVDERSTGTVRVAGVFDDDFRYKAVVSFDGKPAYEQIVADDTLALRFLDPERIPTVVDRAHIATADRSTELAGVDVVQALQSGRWVLDTNAAPPVAALGSSLKDIGKDPVFDALTALGYVDRALVQAQSVDEWKKESLDPAYKSSEDTFPKPADGSKVKRYDLRRPRLPGAAAVATAGATASLPTTRHFRKMAIYTENGRVLRVSERIEVIGKSVDDLSTYFTSMLKESKASKSALAQVEAETRKGQTAEVGQFLLAGISGILTSIGEDPLLVRNMSLEFDRSGDRVPVALPTDNVVKGSLDVFLASAAAKKAAATATGGEKEPGGSPSTTVAGDTPTSAPAP
jgi:hypothetical protein